MFDSLLVHVESRSREQVRITDLGFWTRGHHPVVSDEVVGHNLLFDPRALTGFLEEIGFDA